MSNEMANALITERVPRPLKRRAMEPQALIKDILDKYRPINADGQTEPMQIEAGEEFAANAYDEDSEDDSASDMETTDQFKDANDSSTPIHSSQ
ncbi:hypothetical protein G6F68_010702 [Rhizopus microsporus]|nr:hypothetical protein G6F68_010702 [Rhizopus microsporus]